MVFDNEAEFEQALVDLLVANGWKDGILDHCKEKDLIRNWADILFQNNMGIDRLNGYPLTDSEMSQIIEKINKLKTPNQLNGFINGGTVSIRRDNPDDVDHLGKEVSLKIYNRFEIAKGQSCYQIARQPIFRTKSKIRSNRRGDLLLLINGMPVIHIELKRSGVPVSEAAFQIEKYAGEGHFTGIFSLIQIFVVMNPEETKYFANPGPDGKFNSDFYFHWADFNNEPINDWKRIGSDLLSIPMAHQMIGFYTVADDSDGTLKVMRSYQYYAANRISDKVAKTKWGENSQYGGYVWHTTGSGKTMTSFKSAQLIATSKDADKVVFLVDRIELGTQSLKEYRNFAGAGLTEQQKANTVQETEDTYVLVGKLKSPDPADTLIVTSIQKMSKIKEENEGLKAKDLEIINKKRLVFIVDEAHRSTFGEMLRTIKRTFPYAIFFGFTGTPIHEENQKKNNTTATVFGDELHRYSIADGIRDKNVLGFDPYKVLTFKDEDVRRAVALEKAKAKSEEEAMSDPAKKKVFLKFMEDVPMVGYSEDDGTYVDGIEDYLNNDQYRTEEHQSMVVKDIIDNWSVLSRNHKFHAIFATSSIMEALEYYRRFKEADPNLKVTALFDPNVDNNGEALPKLNGMVELIEDYNKRYGQNFKMATFQGMKKDIAARLAHKKPYERIEKEPDKEIDLLIVVDQMLTGFDSKWINTLYLDKVIKHENIIQAFSRTNRLFGPDKPFGTIKYYRKPHKMEYNIEAAVKLYSGDKPFGLFVQRLDKNLSEMNSLFAQITEVFEQSGVTDFESIPHDSEERKKFADLFRKFNAHLEAAKIQGFTWEESEYTIKDEKTGEEQVITMTFDETDYLILVKRYKELRNPPKDSNGEDKNDGEDVPYELEGYLITIDTDKIDIDYMNSRFDKFLKILFKDDRTEAELKNAKDELHKTFARLSPEQQRHANRFLHDIQSGDVEVVPGMTFMDYVIRSMSEEHNDNVHRFAERLGVDEAMLRDLMKQDVTAKNIDDYGRFEKLKKTVDFNKAKAFFEEKAKKPLPTPIINMNIDELLRNFIIKGGFDIDK